MWSRFGHRDRIRAAVCWMGCSLSEMFGCTCQNNNTIVYSWYNQGRGKCDGSISCRIFPNFPRLWETCFGDVIDTFFLGEVPSQVGFQGLWLSMSIFCEAPTRMVSSSAFAHLRNGPMSMDLVLSPVILNMLEIVHVLYMATATSCVCNCASVAAEGHPLKTFISWEPSAWRCRWRLFLFCSTMWFGVKSRQHWSKYWSLRDTTK